jgi:LCP family protein required for cell wall assembly
MRVHHERRRRLIKRIALVTALVLVAGVVAVGLWAYSILSSAGRTMNAQPGIDDQLAGVLEKRENREPFNVLILGSDARSDDESARADTIIVARIDVQSGKVWMISVPRDTRAQIPGHGTGKINGALFYGGPSLMVETVRDLLGIPIHHYMSVDWTGFQNVVDALGGVWIDVDVLIDDPKAASHSPGGRARRIEPGYQVLDGEHALTYVRSREFPDADFTRMRHQQTFFKALADQATKAGNVLKIPSMVRELAQYTSTDMRVGDLIDVANAMRDIGGGNVETATLLGEWRSPYVWTDEENKAFLIDAMMNGRSFEASEESGADAIDPATISVSVRNGAGIEGSAAAAAEILGTAGYPITEVGNANQFVYDETLVVYKTGRENAVQVAEALPKARVVESRGMYEFSSAVLVVVGKDYANWDGTSGGSQ